MPQEVPAEVVAALLLQPPAPGSAATQKLQLIGAHITGCLQLQYATVEIPFSLVDCRFDAPVELADASLRAADFTGCHMPQLSADRLRVDGDLTLTRLVSHGVSLFGAQVRGDLWLAAARITGYGSGYAVNGPQLRIEGGLYADSAHVTGGVNLWGAQAFTIEVTRARLTGEERPAFRGDGLRLVQDLRCTNLLVEDGGIHLFGATIGGQCWLVNAAVRSSVGWAITAPTLTVGGGVYAHGLTVEGGINLFAAVIGESIELTASTLLPYRRHALRAPGARVEANITLDDATRITGDIVLRRAEVKGTLSLTGTTFSGATNVDLHRATLGELHLESLSSPPTTLDLSSANIAAITDAAESWPSRIALTALTYQALHPVLPASQRLAWLHRGTAYHPQPYEQLAAHYRQLGHDDDARAVLLARHRRRRRSLRAPARLWGYVEDATVGYGYRPGRALMWLLALATVAAIVFSATPPRPAQSGGPAFQPVIFALDLILPILDLGQEKAFTPVGNTAWIAWLSSLSGWLLGTTVITSITRRLTRS
ncbi:hypothetical protein [Streptomyces sp. AK02-01A]|uniref:hypothetical protein n=1 Tax=Streptomyces sp. AK02-01A TaxID=3028648 RepID=UPI0029BB9F8C|nr:hypothetical protein [Streptomyces sp. AK02-01A]MDX3854153.1 hypothetical protein [Streptomyces sp. AK02-01A]